MRKQSGFTLIEILIALVIFAIVGVMAAIGLRSVIRTHHIVVAKNLSLQDLQFAQLLLRRDFAQVVDRKIIDSDGNTLPAMLSQGSMISFTRSGYVNPFAMTSRGELQRVRYQLINHSVVRETWIALDRPPNSHPLQKVILKHVASIYFSFVTNSGSTVTQWPLPTGSNIAKSGAPQVLPRAVIATVTLQVGGSFQDVFALTAVGFNATMPTSQEPSHASVQ